MKAPHTINQAAVDALQRERYLAKHGFKPWVTLATPTNCANVRARRNSQ